MPVQPLDQNLGPDEEKLLGLSNNYENLVCVGNMS